MNDYQSTKLSKAVGLYFGERGMGEERKQHIIEECRKNYHNFANFVSDDFVNFIAGYIDFDEVADEIGLEDF